MVLFFDTSALIKRYVVENGTEAVEKLLGKSKKILVSSFTKLESCSTARRLLQEKRYSEEEYRTLLNEIELDFNYYTLIRYDENVEVIAKEVIDLHQLKTLDALQLASCLRHRVIVQFFVCCDEKLLKAAAREGLSVVNPLE